MIKWKLWFMDYIRWVECNIEIEYIIKVNVIKVKLVIMNKVWEFFRKCWVDGVMIFLVIFDFVVMKEFLDNYVYKDGDKLEDVIDLSEDNL